MPQIYADYNASYPCTEQHLNMLARVIKKTQGNPSSVHSYGREAKLILEEARGQVAALFGGSRKNILFTSGATEANNLALQGFVRSGSVHSATEVRPHVLVSAGEHASISETIREMERKGFCQLESIDLNQEGVLDCERVLSAINHKTRLVSFFYVNSEVGSINPVKELIERIKAVSESIHVHVDAVQAVGKLDLTWMAETKVDSVAASAHKIGGLKGVGCLYLRVGTVLDAMLLGGGQEGRLRSGTENMPGLISFGLRAREILASPRWLERSETAKRHLVAKLRSVSAAVVHGDPEKTVCNTVNFHVEGLSGDRLMIEFDRAGIAVSSGSACSSGVSSPSPVLLAMGYSNWVAINSVRASFGALSTLQDAQAIVTVIERLLES